MKPHCLGVNIWKNDLFFIRIQIYSTPYVSPHKKYVKQLLVESMKMELIITFFRRIDNKYVTAQHFRETIDKCLHCRRYVLVHINFKIVGILSLAYKAVTNLYQ